MIVASHFTPSNLTSVHRSRLWSLYLKEFGWNPIIVTTHWKYYEEPPDWDLHKLVPDDLHVIRTKAIPTKPLRIVGDIGVRSFYWHYKALKDLANSKKIDFVLITIPSNYSALLGRMIWKNYRIPYGIDYIDPWVHEWPGVEKALSKAWFSYHLGRMLEPWATKNCKLITGVAEGYYKEVFIRNPQLVGKVKTAAMPYGISSCDFELVKRKRRDAYLYADTREKFNIVYAGAMLPHAFGVLEKLFEGIRALIDNYQDAMQDVHFHFIGTGKKPEDAHAFNIIPIAKKIGVGVYVSECPKRITYIDTLNHLLQSSAVLIVGSDRPHYTPSKVFQAIVCGKPVLALLHEESTAVQVIQACEAGRVITFRDPGSINVADLAEDIVNFVRQYKDSCFTPDLTNFEPYTARYSALCLAKLMHKVVEGN